jgi:hypothetical protein
MMQENERPPGIAQHIARLIKRISQPTPVPLFIIPRNSVSSAAVPRATSRHKARHGAVHTDRARPRYYLVRDPKHHHQHLTRDSSPPASSIQKQLSPARPPRENSRHQHRNALRRTTRFLHPAQPSATSNSAGRLSNRSREREIKSFSFPGGGKPLSIIRIDRKAEIHQASGSPVTAADEKKNLKSLHPKFDSLRIAANPAKMTPDFHQIANKRLPSGAVLTVIGNLPDGCVHRRSQQLPTELRRRHRERSHTDSGAVEWNFPFMISFDKKSRIRH